jgi:hypothetical protein
MFISYTIFNKSSSINDLERSIYVIKQKTIRVICKIDNERTNIFFFDVFYVSKCFLNLINFDQLNKIRCFMSYKLNLFIIEDQNIITRKRVNNVFFFKLWKHVNYNFIITFIVDDFVETFVETFIESFVNDFSINKKILNI